MIWSATVKMIEDHRTKAVDADANT